MRGDLQVPSDFDPQTSGEDAPAAENSLLLQVGTTNHDNDAGDNDNDAGEVLPPHLFGRLAWRVLPLLWLGYVVQIIDRINLGYAHLQMKRDLNLSQEAFGYASGIFFVAYAVMQVPTNHMIPHVGATRLLASLMVLWGLTASAVSAVRNERQLCVLRFCLGLAESGFYPGVLFFLTRWFPEAVSGRALALFSTAASVGGLVGSGCSGYLMTRLDGVRGVRGWRWLIGAEGFVPVLIGLCLPWLLSERPHEASWLKTDERRALLAALERDSSRSRPAAAKPPADAAAGTPSSSRALLAKHDKLSPLPPRHHALGRSPSEEEMTDGRMVHAHPSSPGLRCTAGVTRTDSECFRIPTSTPRVPASPPPPAPPQTMFSVLRATVATFACGVCTAQYVVSSALTNAARFFLPSLLKALHPSLSAAHIGLLLAVPAALKVCAAHMRILAYCSPCQQLSRFTAEESEGQGGREGWRAGGRAGGREGGRAGGRAAARRRTPPVQ